MLKAFQLCLVFLKRNHLEKRVVQPEPNHPGLGVNDSKGAGLGLLADLVSHIAVSARHDLETCTFSLNLKDHCMVLLRNNEQTIFFCTQRSKQFHDLETCTFSLNLKDHCMARHDL